MSSVTRLMREAARPRPLSVGLKLFNAMFDEGFQIDMLRLVNERCGADGRPDFIVYANRLFDPEREFEGKRGVAYGGPDLSARNLRVLARLRARSSAAGAALRVPRAPPATSARGAWRRVTAPGRGHFPDAHLLPAPNDQYRMSRGSRTERALHELYFNPERDCWPACCG